MTPLKSKGLYYLSARKVCNDKVYDSANLLLYKAEKWECLIDLSLSIHEHRREIGLEEKCLLKTNS